MNRLRQRPLSLGHLRALDAVARKLSFSAAAEELHVTQSAVSRQIKALEDELGAPLFVRGTRHVELAPAGATLLRAVAPWLDRLDATVRQIRQTRGRRVVAVSTFASFATMWLIPRLIEFQKQHPDIDIRISASDQFVDPAAGDGAQIDLALRFCRPEQAPAGATRLFDEWVAPVASRWLLAHADEAGEPLDAPQALCRHALLEVDDLRPSSEYLSWSSWLRQLGFANLQPARWLYFDYTHQQVQAALSGQGVALARLALATEPLQQGELVEPFRHRAGTCVPTPYAYWMIAAPGAAPAPEVAQFSAWVLEEADATRKAIGALVAQ